MNDCDAYSYSGVKGTVEREGNTANFSIILPKGGEGKNLILWPYGRMNN